MPAPARPVYLDYAATTPVDPRVFEAMTPALTTHWANPNSLYSQGRDAFRLLEQAREEFASLVGASESSEIVFTGSGTESDISAIIGVARAASPGKGNHVVVSSFEHKAVLEAGARLAREGFEVSRLEPRNDGVVHPDDLRSYLREDTVLVSVMAANNEIGTVQDVSALSSATHEAGALFHTDAVQALGKTPFHVGEMGIDAAAFSAHKIYGPKGVGAMYLRQGVPFEPLIVGGGQEKKRRSGTQNVAGALALAKAASLMDDERETELPRLGGMRDRIVDGVLDSVGDVTLVGSTEHRLPHVANFLVAGTEGESILLRLDAEGIAVATGSACSSASLDPSHVLTAIGCPKELAFGSVRVSVGRFTTDEDVTCFLEAFPRVVESLRGSSAGEGRRASAREG